MGKCPCTLPVVTSMFTCAYFARFQISFVCPGAPLCLFLQIRAFQKGLDSNADGAISLEEFRSALMREMYEVQKELGLAWDAVLDFTISQKTGIREIFMRFDEDGSGFLDLTELANGLVALGVELRPRGLRALLRDVDTGGDGVVSLAEFFEAVAKYQGRTKYDPAAADRAWPALLAFFADAHGLEALAQLFRSMDRDGTGSLDLGELTLGLVKSGLELSPVEVRSLQRALDRNRDGKITYAEFVTALDERQGMVESNSWQQVTSSSGEAYWHNSFTGVSRWDMPPNMPRPPPSNPSYPSTAGATALSSDQTAAAARGWEALLDFLSDDRNYEQLSLRFQGGLDGQIGLADLMHGLAAGGFQLAEEVEAAALKLELDVNGNGLVSYPGFVALVEQRQAKLIAASWHQITSSSGGAYWHNKFTGESRWDTPPKMGTGEGRYDGNGSRL
mmetsp:Transcript_55802/g.126824  ORF Transcript_55802/g.126824 Transcript_55802/m.126824 type:complete len:447 (+) Transcript_55802:151-1491(+)